VKNLCSGTHHRESSDLLPAAPPFAGLNRRTVLGNKGSLRCGMRRALASCAPFCTICIRDGRLRRESDRTRFLRLTKDKNQVVVDKTSSEEKKMLIVFAGTWWLMALRGAVAILFGLIAFLRPSVALEALAILFGVYAFVDGGLSLCAAFWRAPREDRWWMLFFEGVLGLVAGIFALAWTPIAALALIYIVAAWALLTGVLEIWAATVLRRHLTGELGLALAGFVSLLLGFVLMAEPGIGALMVAWIIGGYALLFGTAMLILSVRLRKWLRAMRPELV